MEPSSALEEVDIGMDPFEGVNKFRRRKKFSLGDQTSVAKTRLDLSDLSDLEDDLKNNGRRDASITQAYFQQVLDK